MQKKLLTMAVAGALAVPGLALAQSSVEVYGTINMSFGNVKYDAVSPNAALPAGAPSVSKWDVANHASNYGLRGRESLGAGLTAWFQIEQNAPLERSNNVAITPASRNSAVGVQGAWGNVFMGQWTTPWADLESLWSIGTVGGWGPTTSIIGRRETTGTAPNFNCANAGHGIATGCDAVEAGGGVGHPFWRRISQAVFYQSPVFGGAQAKFAYQTNEGKASAGPIVASADPSMWSASIQWAGMGGRLRVGAAYDNHKEFSSVGQDDTGWKLAGGWNFGFADVGLVWEHLEYNLPVSAVTGVFSGVECKQDNWGVAVAVPVGSGFIRGSFAQADEMDGTGCATIAGNPANGGGGKAKTWNLGYEHRFSKRTSVGVGYATIDNEGVAAFAWTGLPSNQLGGSALTNGPLPGGDVSTFFVNMVHRF
jgi:predicted porin